MSVTLCPKSEELIQRLSEAGAYPDADAVIRDALHLLEEHERKRQWRRAELRSAVEQAERGELIDVTPERFEDLKQRAIESTRQGKPVRDAVKREAALSFFLMPFESDSLSAGGCFL